MKVQLTRPIWFALAIASLFVIGAWTHFRPSKVFRVGMLNPDTPLEGVIDGFKAEMAALGYIEGQDVEYIYAGAVGNGPDKLEAAADALRAADVDLVLAVANTAAAAAKVVFEETDIPTIFWVMADPVAENYVHDLQVPGTNMTGITIGIEGIASEGKRLEWLTQVSPDIHKVLIPYDPTHNDVVEQVLPTIREVAESLGIELMLHEVHNPEEARTLAKQMPEDIDAVYLIHLDRMVMSAHRAFVVNAIKRQLPLSIFIDSAVRNGALISFGTRYFAIGEQAAHMADHLLTGAQAAEMPVEIPEFFLSINLNTADAIGLDIPDSIVRQADVVIR